jgi:Cu/Ag efflux pump CusA
VLLTASVLVPAAVWGGQAGLEFLHPLAVTMLGGLVSLLVVQLLVLPALLMTTAGQHPAGRGPRPSSHEPADDTSPVIAREAQ